MSPIQSIKRLGDQFDLQIAGKWLVLGTAVGALTGAVAIAFHLAIQALGGFLLVHLAGLPIEQPRGEPLDFGFARGRALPWLILLLPPAGGLVSGVLVHWLAPSAAGPGTDAAVRAYHRDLGRIPARVPLVKFAASVLLLGTGGSGGREGPIAQIGAGIGSLLAERLHLTAQERRWLLAAGIGAGVGAIFRAPLAGALFAAEVLYSSSEVESEVLLPATVSSIVAYSVFCARFGWGHMFEGVGAFGFGNPLELGPYLALAVVVSVAALAYVNSVFAVRALFGRSPIPLALRPMVGGAAVGLIGFGLYEATAGDADVLGVIGSGYGVIQRIVDTDGRGLAIGLLVLVAAGKVVTTSFSLGSGGSGGLFGPAMVIGACLGGAVGLVFQGIPPFETIHPTSYAVVGMAGFFAAAANTPLSTVVMVSELTGNYELLIPSMWVCALAFLLSKRWSLYPSQLPSRMLSQAHLGEAAPALLGATTVGDTFRKSRRFVALRAAMTVLEAADLTAGTRQRLFPVLDDAGRLVGSFRIDALVHALQASSPPARVADIMEPETLSVRPSQSVAEAWWLLRRSHVDEIAVVDDADPARFVGILTGADVLLGYTQQVAALGRDRAVAADVESEAEADDSRG